MGKYFIALLFVLPMLVLGGCASTPQENSQTAVLQTEIDTLRVPPGEEQLAPVAVRKAQEHLDRLKELAESGAPKEVYDHHLYLTQKQIEIAHETITQKQAEKVISTAEVRRKDILLEAAQQNAASMSEKAQSLQQQVSDLTTSDSARGLVLTLGSVLFETNKSSLQEGSRRTVAKVADFLKQYPERHILIEGFTDSQGAEEYNQKLSEERANSVKAVLVQNGVQSSRVKIQGYGEDFPVATNSTPAGRQQNRRVEIIVGNENNTNVTDRTTMTYPE